MAVLWKRLSFTANLGNHEFDKIEVQVKAISMEEIYMDKIPSITALMRLPGVREVLQMDRPPLGQRPSPGWVNFPDRIRRIRNSIAGLNEVWYREYDDPNPEPSKASKWLEARHLEYEGD